MDKMKLAHEMALELVKIKPGLSAWQIADRCFEYADAMQKEADSRKPKGLPQALSPEVTHLNNTLAAQKMGINIYPEWDAPINYPPDAWVMYRGEKRLAVSIKDEFQPTGYEP